MTFEEAEGLVRYYLRQEKGWEDEIVFYARSSSGGGYIHLQTSSPRNGYFTVHKEERAITYARWNETVHLDFNRTRETYVRPS